MRKIKKHRINLRETENRINLRETESELTTRKQKNVRNTTEPLSYY